jgi:hypothetical protein
LPDVAFGGVVVCLGLGDLQLALDVAVVVGRLVVVDLLAAGGFHGVTSEAGMRGGDDAVGGDSCGEADYGEEDGGLVLHFERGIFGFVAKRLKKQ